MREKRRGKKVFDNSSKVSLVNEQISFVNGLYCEDIKKSVITTNSVNNSKLAEKWNAMDYEKYFMYRFDISSLTLPPSELNDSSDKKNNSAPGDVFKFYKNVARDFWNVFPKTDYTYSPPSPWYNKEYASGVPVMPNLSRRTVRWDDQTTAVPNPSEYISNAEHFSQEVYLSKAEKLPLTSTPISNGHPNFRSRYGSRKKNNWIWNDWSRTTYEKIKTVTITTITTTVTTIIETVMHPLRKPFLSFPIIFILLALLLHLLLTTVKGVEGDVTIIKMPSPQIVELQTFTTDSLVALFSMIAKPFIWAYELATICLYSMATCLYMIPTILSQLAQALNACLFLFFQKITGWVSQYSAVVTSIGGPILSTTTERSEIINYAEKVLQILTNKERETSTKKRSAKEELFIQALNEIRKENETKDKEALKDSIWKLYEKLDNAGKEAFKEFIWNKLFEEVGPQDEQFKNMVEKLVINHNSGQEISHREGSSNIPSVDVWPEIREKVVHIVNYMLKQYHADRTGMPDYALMSNGGSILSIRCTQTYTKDSGNLYLFGLPLWNVNSNPEIIIKPGTMPGECWAFEGSEGSVAISLSMPIFVGGFTMEHTPKELSPHGNIKSAPHQFSVWALQDLKDEKPLFLGRFKFLDNGESLQYFESEKLDVPVRLVELRIESNHGSIDYTCLYRFRVHGRPAINN
uniref:SUN domain-containing protein n=1 Tax=Rhodnius prolixus TaxID=13249 RepID=T1HHY6_RHOPR